MTSTIPDAPPSFPPQSLVTPRLTLRRPEPADDAATLVERWASDPEVTRYLLWTAYAPGDVGPAEQFLGLCGANWDSGHGHRPWMVCEHGDRRPIGMIGITPGSASHSYEVGYVFGRAWWGRGFATEATSAVATALFTDPRTWRVYAPTHADNLASQRVLAKAGFQREGTLRRLLVFPGFGPEPQHCVLWSITRDDIAPAPSSTLGASTR